MSGERRIRPSARRLRRAAEQGRAPLSGRLVALGGLLGLLLALLWEGERVWRRLLQMISSGLLRATEPGALGGTRPAEALADPLLELGLPLLLGPLVGVLLVTLVQLRGRLWRGEGGRRGGVEDSAGWIGRLAGGVWGVLVTLAVCGVGAAVLFGARFALFELPLSGVEGGAAVSLDLLQRVLGMSLLLCLLLGLLELAVLHHRHRRSLRLTVAEGRRQRRAEEGAPEARRALRRLLQGLSAAPTPEQGLDGARCLLIAAPDRAVAVAHDTEKQGPPRVCGAWRGGAGARAVELARSLHLEVVPHPELVDALERVRPGAPVPRRFYLPLAAVLRALERRVDPG